MVGCLTTSTNDFPLVVFPILSHMQSVFCVFFFFPFFFFQSLQCGKRTQNSFHLFQYPIDFSTLVESHFQLIDTVIISALSSPAYFYQRAHPKSKPHYPLGKSSSLRSAVFRFRESIWLRQKMLLSAHGHGDRKRYNCGLSLPMFWYRHVQKCLSLAVAVPWLTSIRG